MSMDMAKCPFCDKEVGTSGICGHIRGKHPEEWESKGWDAIKQMVFGQSPAPEQAPVPPELTGDELQRPEEVEIDWEDNKDFSMKVSRTMPSKSLRLDSRIDVLYSFLKGKGKIPKHWTLGEFINHYVIDNVHRKDGVNLAVTQEITGEENRRVMLMENEYSEQKKEKATEEIINDMQKRKVLDLQLKQFEAEMGGKSQPAAGYFDQLRQLINDMTAQKMAMSMVNKLFPEENNGGGKKGSSEVEALKEQLKAEKEARDKAELKSAMDKLAEAVKESKGGKEVGTKDLVQMMMLNQRQQSDFKDTLHSKDTEMLRMALENQNKVLVDRLGTMSSQPTAVDKVKEIKEMASALKGTGLLGETEKSGAELAKDLIGTTVTALGPAINKFAEGMSQAQQQQASEYELARMAQIQQQTSPQPQPSAVVALPMPEPVQVPNDIYGNLINISDQDDRIKRRQQQGF